MSWTQARRAQADILSRHRSRPRASDGTKKSADPKVSAYRNNVYNGCLFEVDIIQIRHAGFVVDTHLIEPLSQRHRDDNIGEALPAYSRYSN